MKKQELIEENAELRSKLNDTVNEREVVKRTLTDIITEYVDKGNLYSNGSRTETFSWMEISAEIGKLLKFKNDVYLVQRMQEVDSSLNKMGDDLYNFLQTNDKNKKEEGGETREQDSVRDIGAFN